MPNPRRSSACDCTCVLTRIDHSLVNNSIMTFALELIWHAFRYQFIRSIQNRNDKLQVQQLYTAGIPLLEAYLLPIAIIELAKNVSPKNKMAASNVVQIHTGFTKFTQLHVVTSQFVMFIPCALRARIEDGTGSRHVNWTRRSSV